MATSDNKLLNEDQSSPTKGAFGPASCFIAGRDAPKGSIGWHVDCPDNPLDLRPAVDTILRAIDETLPTVSAGSPLVVLMGESHAMPGLTQLLPFLATRLAQRGHRFSVAFEHPHDMWVQTADKLNIDILPELRTAPGYLHDTDGTATLSGVLGFSSLGEAPLSNLNTLKTVYDLVRKSGGRIQALFNDAAISDVLLDLSDPLTRGIVTTYAQACAKDPATIVWEPWLPDAVACRNRVMVSSAMEHARRHDVQIVLQHTGRNHLFGHSGDRARFVDSLASLFTRAGVRVLPVFLTRFEKDCGLNTPPLEAREAFAEAVVVDGLAENSFRRPIEEFWDWADKKPEINFLTALYEASGRKEVPQDLSTTTPREEWEAIAREHIEGTLKNHAAASADFHM